MQITYRTLGLLIAKMDDNQLDSDVTVELDEGECFPAELRIAGEEHSGGLDDGHPVLYCNFYAPGVRRDDVEQLALDIGILK